MHCLEFPSFFSNGGLLILLLVAMFAIMIIPQRRRDKKIKNMLSAVKVGDRVRTIGGIYGTVSAIKDDIMTLSVGPDKVRLVFARGAIATVENAPQGGCGGGKYHRRPEII